MDTQQLDDILHEVVCISNLSIRRLQFLKRHKIEIKSKNKYDTVLLVTTGTMRACILDEDSFTEVKAPHILILEKEKEYTLESLDNYVEAYDISALRHSTGDIVNPENLVRTNYPFNTGVSLEEQ